jgi:3-oxoacyl-[acyl-carrier-protein] synthase III
MSANVRLVATGSYLPEKVLTNADFEKMVDTSDEWIVSRTGIRERRILSDGETVSDMVVGASRRALETAGLEVSDIDHIAVCTFTADYRMPSAACLVQEKLGAPQASAVDLSAACSGFIYGLSHGAGMILSGQAKRVLVIAAEALSKVTDYQDRSTCVLFGDGAGAVILSGEEGGHRVADIVLGADGAGAQALVIPAGGSLQPASHESVDQRGHFIKMKGSEVFKFAVPRLISVIREAAAGRNIAPADIDLVVPHQVNQRIIKAASDRLDMSEDQFFCNLEKYGNTSGASVAIALDEAVREGRIKSGRHALLVVFGGGYTWASAFLDW